MQLLLRPILGAVLATSLLLSGCGDSTNDFSSPPISSAPSTPAYAAVLAPKVEALRKEMLVPGVVVVVRSARLGNWSSAFGYRDLEKTSAIALTDHFRIGSNTKTMTGTIILQLVDEGLLELDDPIGDYVAGVPNGDIVTIEQLLEMRSGLDTYSNTLELNEQLDNNPLRVWLPEELLEIAFAKPVTPPGVEFEYSNTNFILLGLVIEELTGRTVEQAFEERIFTPLGMTQTLMPLRASNAIPQDHPPGYQFGTNVSTLLGGDALPADQQPLAYAGTLLPNDVTNENPSWAWTAGGAISTAEELADYAEALVGGGLLSPELQARRLSSFIAVDPENPAKSAYGWALGDFGAIIGHSGELPGYNSFMGHDPNLGITVIVWTNLNNAPDGRPPAVTIARKIIKELDAELTEPAPGLDDE